MLKAKITLEDGTILEGISFGSNQSVSGEVVFNTAMTGYTESLTDPSYKGQIMVMTFPLVGNYGVPGDSIDQEMNVFYESNKIHIQGLIVTNYSENYSHWNAKKSLSQWLIENNIPAIHGIDTRALTQKLRESGSMLGKIEIENQVAFSDPNKENLVDLVSTKEVKTYGSGKHKIILVDCGVKNNIIRCLLKHDTTVVKVPWNYDFTKEEYDGLFISNGPGDPEMCTETIKHLEIAINQDKPIFGICLGNQLLGLAAGAKTFKLKYGHRSHNQPVLMVGTNTCFVTSQNHGYAIDIDSLDENWEALFINLNDKTCEGIKHKTKPFFSSQFHPEASGGPVDTEFLFGKFMDEVKKNKK
ncbi:MAG: glutamine-hydrolyzing carbamoyl-phosphate synthase small subunit [Solirubrobacteraceae bacterium]